MFKNVQKEEITIPAQMSYLIQIRDFIEHIGKKYRYHDKLINSFKLVVDEACTNIIRHGYRDIKNGEITIKAIIRRLSLTIVIVDHGRAYDPRQANTPDLAKYVDIGKKGGLGILMMRKLMDDLQYSVTENGNEFRLSKYRETTHESKAIQAWHALNLKMKYSIFAALIFIILAMLVFVPVYLNLENSTRDDALKIAAAASVSLADNALDDLLNENDTKLFEKAYALRMAHPDIVEEVFVTDSTGRIHAWANTGKVYDFNIYTFSENAQPVDTLGRTYVALNTLSDTSHVYDLATKIVFGNTNLGNVHVWTSQEKIQTRVNHLKIKIIIILLVILVLGFIALFFLIHKILAPFHNLADWVRQVVHGKVDQDEIDIDASDEIGEIAQAFNEMTNKFREAQVNLMEQQKLQKELQVAQEIQQMLLPSDFPKVEGYEIASYYEAAKEVGGDLFDFVEVDDDSIGIIVADVSGKGVPGSLIMTMIRTALRLESRGNKNPADVLARVNRFVADDMKRGMFVTMFYIILDSRNREIHFASAGHNPMILYRGSTKQTYYLNPTGFPVGIQLPDLDLFARKIQTDSIRLKEDDILVLYTDGITEAMNSNRELFREERFLNAIRQNSHLDVGEFVKSINNELKNFTGGAPQNDDITFVAIKEKMMSGEVMYNLHEEVARLIESGVKVKDALEQLRISPHQYYTYQEIIKRKGKKGLKAYLDSRDVVEKKHLSIELKTKVFDIIRKHPDYGPKLIAYELRKDEYGNVRIDPDRIYNELVKLRLNTQELRMRYMVKGGKKRIKQPGTPLMTLDGQVILDFESSADVISKRNNAQSATPFKPLSTPEEPKKSVHKINIVSSEPKQKQPDTVQPAREMAEPEPPKKEKPEITFPPSPQPTPKRKTAVKKKLTGQPETKADLIKKVTPVLKQEEISELYQNVKDDIEQVRKLLKGLPKSEAQKADVHKINVLFKMISRHPSLKKMPEISRVFGQMHDVFVFMDDHFEQIPENELLINAKDMLKYVEKDNKFKDYSRLFESINKIGLIRRRLEQGLSTTKENQSNQLDQIRAKLVQKNIINKSSVTPPVTEKNEDQH